MSIPNVFARRPPRTAVRAVPPMRENNVVRRYSHLLAFDFSLDHLAIWRKLGARVHGRAKRFARRRCPVSVWLVGADSAREALDAREVGRVARGTVRI